MSSTRCAGALHDFRRRGGRVSGLLGAVRGADHGGWE
jgi:hypothetical protein